MRSWATPQAAPAQGAAQRRPWHSHERDEVEVALFGGRQYSYPTALYCVEWQREYGPDPDDCRGYLYPSVELIDLLGPNGASLLNAAGRRQCAAIARQLAEYEYEGGPPDPPSFYHYD